MVKLYLVGVLRVDIREYDGYVCSEIPKFCFEELEEAEAKYQELSASDVLERDYYTRAYIVEASRDGFKELKGSWCHAPDWEELVVFQFIVETLKS